MQDQLLATVVAGALAGLVLVVSSAIAAQHTDAAVPKILAGRQYRRGSRGSLLISVGWAVVILGGGQVVMVLLLVHPASSIGVRIVAGLELAITILWLWHLRGLIRREPRATE